MRPRAEKDKLAPVFLILIFIVLASGILTAGYFAYHQYKRRYRKEVELQLSAVAELKVNQLAQWRNERLSDANVFYGNSVFSGLVKRFFENQTDADAKSRMQEWMEQIATAYSYNRIGLCDAEGVEHISIPSANSHSPLISSESCAEDINSGRVVFQDFYRDKNDHQVYLNIFVPILDEHNSSQVLGVITMRIDPRAYLFPFIQSWPSPSKTAETLIIRRDGNDVLFLNELKFRKEAALTLRISLESEDVPTVRAALGQEGIVDGNDYRGIKVIAAVRTVPDSPWFLIAKMDKQEIYAPLRERWWLMILLVGTLLISAGTSMGLLWRRQQNLFYREQYDSAEALRSLSTRQEAILSAVPDIIMEVNNDKVYTWANQAGINFFGKDVIGKEASFYFEGEQETYKSVQPLFNGKDDVIYIESWQRRKDGKKRLLAWWCRALKDESGKVTGALSSARDITAYRQAEDKIRKLNANLEDRVIKRTAQLEAANNELEAFSYSVSHDLRAPLRHVSGYVDLLKSRFETELPEKGAYYLDTITDSVHRMGVLIDDLLQFSRTGRAEMIESDLDMNRIVEEVKEQLREENSERDIQWSISRLPSVHADSAMLYLVWMNLLSNAVKFTGKKKTAGIEIGFREGTKDFIFFVRDDGVGFDMKYAQNLFGVFQRLHPPEDFEGTGIGLANVHRIVSRHGGRTWAEAEPDKGAIFYFTLPKKKEKNP